MTLYRTLEGLANVGRVPVAFRFHPDIFSLELLEAGLADCASSVSVDASGVVTFQPGPDSRESLRRFTSALIAARRDAV